MVSFVEEGVGTRNALNFLMLDPDGLASLCVIGDYRGPKMAGMARQRQSKERVERGFWVVEGFLRGELPAEQPIDPDGPECSQRADSFAAAAAENPGSWAISMGEYDRARAKLLDAWGVESAKGNHAWPATAQTVSKVVGGGSWNGVMQELGLPTSKRGRQAGSGRFSDEGALTALREFTEYSAREGSSASYVQYGRWVLRMRAKGRDVPTGPTIRQRFGSWSGALEAAKQ